MQGGLDLSPLSPSQLHADVIRVTAERDQLRLERERLAQRWLQRHGFVQRHDATLRMLLCNQNVRQAVFLARSHADVEKISPLGKKALPIMLHPCNRPPHPPAHPSTHFGPALSTNHMRL